MQKIMFNDKYGLTQAVLEGRKTMTRRLVPEGTPLGNWEETIKHSRYKVGEVVAIAQAYKNVEPELNTSGVKRVYNQSLDIYEHPLALTPGWTNKMFTKPELMPRQIRITNVRVERLQDISDEDCLREGISESLFLHHIDKDGVPFSPREAFSALIDKVSGKGTWGSNPWVFVYEFELVK